MTSDACARISLDQRAPAVVGLVLQEGGVLADGGQVGAADQETRIRSDRVRRQLSERCQTAR
ncbi:hypothetical protein LT493_17850 [Streptomyces tricolor]|nr:hypothetical protein [Streptomyces tricolor]